MRTRKAYYVESIDVMDMNIRETVGQEFRNKKFAVTLLKELNESGIKSKIFILRERYINA